LSFHDNEIIAGDLTAQAISEVLKRGRALTNIDLHGNNISDKGAQELASALKINVTLQHLNLERNDINETGAKQLVDALQSNPHHNLITLNLLNNNFCGPILTTLQNLLRK
jgi:Ran GTPase-activating protein (RanGAP) involved in mRNA processing and transport